MRLLLTCRHVLYGWGGSNQLGNQPTGNMTRHRKLIVLKLNPYTDLCGYNNGFRRIARVEINLGQTEYARSGERGRKSARAQVTDDQMYDLTGPRLHYDAIPRLIHFPGIAQHRPRQSVITTALLVHQHDTRLMKRDATNNANFRTVNLSAE